MKWIALTHPRDPTVPCAIESLKSLCIRVLRSNASRLDTICRSYLRRGECFSKKLAEDSKDELCDQSLLRSLSVPLDAHIVAELIKGIDNVEVLSRMLGALRRVSPDVDSDAEVGRLGWRKIVDSKYMSRGDRFLCPFDDAVRLVHFLLSLVEHFLGINVRATLSIPVEILAGPGSDWSLEDSDEDRAYLVSILCPEDQGLVARLADRNPSIAIKAPASPDGGRIIGSPQLVEAAYASLRIIGHQVAYSTLLVKRSDAGTRMRAICEAARKLSECHKMTPTPRSQIGVKRDAGSGSGMLGKRQRTDRDGDKEGCGALHSMADIAVLAREINARWRSIYRAGTSAPSPAATAPSTTGRPATKPGSDESDGVEGHLRESYELGVVFESRVLTWYDLLQFCDEEEERKRSQVVARMQRRKAEEEAALRLTKPLALAPSRPYTSPSSAAKPFVSIRQMFSKELAKSPVHSRPSSSSVIGGSGRSGGGVIGTASTVQQHVVRTSSGAVMTVPRKLLHPGK